MKEEQCCYNEETQEFYSLDKISPTKWICSNCGTKFYDLEEEE